MKSVVTALHDLQQQLTANFPSRPGTQLLTVPLTLSDASDALAWLAAQSCWPQFYWQQRSGDQELAALGAVKQFAAFPEAQAFIQAGPREYDLLVCGLNAFEPATGQLFLPRLLWQRLRGKATLTLTLHSDHSLADDARAALDFLTGLVPARPIGPLALHLEDERHHPDEGQWHRLLNRALDELSAGQMDKVVLARATDLTFSGPVSAAGLLAASRRVNLNCYHFYMAFDAGNAFLGSSPERLWRRIDGALRTEALAGTVANSDNDAQASRLGAWLLSDDKNQRENMLVVEDICQRLNGITDSLEVLPAQVLRLRKVQHLRRCIWTTLYKNDDALCLHQLQPTAAVAGLPRDLARQFIEHYEPFERQWYAGSAGYLSRERTEFCVSLRSAQVNDCRLRLYAGAGIVPGSDPAQEWQEIENKAAGLRSLLFTKYE